MSIQALRERRNELAKQARHQMAEKGDQKWTADDKSAFDTLADEIDRLDNQIATTQRLLDQAAEDRFDDIKRKAPADKDKTSPRALLDKLLRHGPSAMTADEMHLVRNTLSTTTGSEGGYSVQSDVAKELIDALKGYRGVREAAGNITTEMGNPLSYPSSDGTSEVGEQVAENTTAADADPTFGTVALNCYKFGSKSIAVPIELLQDASIDIVAMINQRVRDRIGRIQNQRFTTGTGSSQPNGIVTAAGAGKVGTTGQTTSIIYEDLVDLVDAIDYAYDDGSMKFMMSQAARKMVRKLKDSAGRPLWTPSYDLGIAGGKAEELMGHQVVLNNDMATPAANTKSIIFGRLDKYMVRDAMQVTLFRFEDSAFLLKGQIGFVAWARAGGNLLDAAGVKYYQHSAT